MPTKKEKQWLLRISLPILVLGVIMPSIFGFKDCAIKKELLAANKGSIVDPYTGNVVCKKTTIRAIEREKKKGISNKVVSVILCGRKVTGVKTEIDALLRANKAMIAYARSKGKKGWKWKCIQVRSSTRSNRYQYKSYHGAIQRDSSGNIIKKRNGKPKLKYVVGRPCYSFHEAGRAFDINNWFQAQKFLWKEGFTGGSRGLHADYGHFSRGEFPNAKTLSWRYFKNIGGITSGKAKRGWRRIIRRIRKK